MIDWPRELQPYTMEWGRVFNSYAFTSPFSQAQQVVSHPGAYWRCSLSFRNLKRPQERVLSTFIGSLHGMAGTFRLRPWTRPPGPAMGNAVVDGGGQAGAQLVTRGWNANRLVLRRGDYITVNDQLLEVLDNITSNGDGRAVLPVSPWLRSPPAIGSQVNYLAPYAIMRLTRDDTSLTVQTLVAGGTLEAREAF